MQVTLTKVFTTDKKKDAEGKYTIPLVSKKGKPYTRMSIKTQEHGEKWLSGFSNKGNSFWKEGMQVDIKVVENGQYLNFEQDGTQQDRSNNNEKLEERIAKLEARIEKYHPEPVATGEVDEATGKHIMTDGSTSNEINAADLPF